MSSSSRITRSRRKSMPAPNPRKRKYKFTSTEFVFDNFEYCRNKMVKGITYLECLHRKRGCHARGKLDKSGKFTLTKPHETHEADPIAYTFRMYRAQLKLSKEFMTNVIDRMNDFEQNAIFPLTQEDDKKIQTQDMDHSLIQNSAAMSYDQNQSTSGIYPNELMELKIKEECCEISDNQFEEWNSGDTTNYDTGLNDNFQNWREDVNAVTQYIDNSHKTKEEPDDLEEPEFEEWKEEDIKTLLKCTNTSSVCKEEGIPHCCLCDAVFLDEGDLVQHVTNQH